MKEYTLTLTEDEMNHILFALAKLPYENAVGVISEIHNQVDEQKGKVRDE